jgi:hypothetical protein
MLVVRTTIADLLSHCSRFFLQLLILFLNHLPGCFLWFFVSLLISRFLFFVLQLKFCVHIVSVF